MGQIMPPWYTPREYSNHMLLKNSLVELLFMLVKMTSYQLVSFNFHFKANATFLYLNFA